MAAAAAAAVEQHGQQEACPNSDGTAAAAVRRRVATMRLSQENADRVGPRPYRALHRRRPGHREIHPIFPFVPDADADEDHLPEIYYDDEPEALLFRVEYGSNGFVEVEYDVDEFEETQRLQEERRLWRAHVWEKIFADDPPEEGEFAEYVSVYNQETRAFEVRPKELEEGTRTIAVFDKVKMKLVLKKLDQYLVL
ncbi:hypothetical protein OsI_09889 [Oryza sativa Indica Group]|uniref:Uncharacterized protein n=1 Tax=Oryza sativa subsp. indica TaxID=39946 RepID=B8AMF9_ORYSI|nr:hypothetical protein OsI_09889 [Oryza sativa Indica Group]